MFRALREIADPTYRAALIGLRPNERQEVELLLDAYGVRDNVEGFEWLAQPEVNAMLNRSKVAVITSLKEGDNKSLLEAFFANTPGLAIRNNMAISSAYFNDQTGMLVDERDLARALCHFRERWSDYTPRAWAEAHMTAARSTAMLNAVLERLARAQGEQWTSDIVVKSNSPRVRYYPDASAGRGLPSMSEILSRYGRPG